MVVRNNQADTSVLAFGVLLVVPVILLFHSIFISSVWPMYLRNREKFRMASCLSDSRCLRQNRTL